MRTRAPTGPATSVPVDCVALLAAALPLSPDAHKSARKHAQIACVRGICFATVDFDVTVQRHSLTSRRQCVTSVRDVAMAARAVDLALQRPSDVVEPLATADADRTRRLWGRAERIRARLSRRASMWRQCASSSGTAHEIQRDATQSRMVYAEIKCETRWLMHSVSWVLPSCLLVLKAFRLARGLLQTALGMASDVTQTDCL